LLGDAVVDAMLAPARARLSALAAATPPPEPDQTLGQISILFLVVVGSTTLSQNWTPNPLSPRPFAYAVHRLGTATRLNKCGCATAEDG
jgi:hypothetical protein